MANRIQVSLPPHMLKIVKQVAKGRGVSMARVLLNTLEEQRMSLIEEAAKYEKKK